MPAASLDLLGRDTRSYWVKLRTLILLRWLAIVGQVAAIITATVVFDLVLPMGLCALVIGAAVIANMTAGFIFPENKRLTEAEAMTTLLFDISQLALLLGLTGGLHNPFALLILAPVTISASALELQTTIILGIVAIFLVTVITFTNLPLRFADGSVLSVPGIFEFGFWLAIVIGIVFLAVYSRRVATEIRSMSDGLLAAQMALAREQKLTDLGGVVAAAAHELGTPLATIKLVSSELFEELAEWPELQEDAGLIRSQADRCRDILQSMGRAGKDDLHLHQAPIAAVLREAAEPHIKRKKEISFSLGSGGLGDARQPTILRSPEIIHGIRNLIQNAVDFAESRVWVDALWDDRQITLRISDDGPGYPPNVIGRIGDPFVRNRRDEHHDAKRPEYEGMGLGLFIAKTLLERSGAKLTFANGTDPFLSSEENPERSGAIVEVVWPIDRIRASDAVTGENQLILP
ncbi:ActS/PrrB/RegB family redox-sensitive histidine kinase [Tabrizicola sp. J26]|uniref:sensor histidine kinase RegB n=1 Tax=Alitabrizicola rongguiensis TaxID=2909234 RepID=UPI001F44B5F0|nr:ActS/PrrB/RegB family redox-sensitive histidine kinase [Tabrizicola rongguiensis]MCF1708233.1 ActS/PrrB/RegB family redox-sensitive histidine kinase [Tabrizicola rongguiensis]